MKDDNLNDTQQKALEEVAKQLREEKFNPPLTAEQILNRRGSVGKLNIQQEELIETVNIDRIYICSVFEKEIWNKAIEAAAVEAYKSCYPVADRIRTLKK